MQVTQYLLKWQDWPLTAASWEPACHLPRALIKWVSCLKFSTKSKKKDWRDWYFLWNRIFFNKLTPIHYILVHTLSYLLCCFFFLFSSYSHPRPSHEKIELFTETLQEGIEQKLGSKSHDIVLALRLEHDVFRHLFGGKGQPAPEHPGQVLFNKKDFDACNLPEHWWYCFDKHGQGKAISFPVRAKVHLRHSRKKYIQHNGKIEIAPQKPVEMVTFYVGRRQRCVDNI